ncbi:Ada DNA repair metal-binding [Penicillium bovifimosum]|uniref:Ada DNA repair metal-binding n=1 Tax=Penicillium bovifimosum TaxID=126998 RepID=A0A9W9HG90_9EURO|nr:Ada DNA repair metal-binding [Penicillium bovifimosum]KAJ5146315.1 Ada DNA repair metal-binding [Penicillium bovifimosum]
MPGMSKPQRISRLSANTATDTERWQAITTRDITANAFVYAVLTTKIYCRPSCPARLARRANVLFYDTPSQAEEAGFRPCKRCRPHSGQTAAQNNPQTAVVEKACESVRNILSAGLKPKPRDLAAQAGLTSSHFHRVFKKHVGVTPGQYIDRLVQDKSCSPVSLASDACFGGETVCLCSEEGKEILDHGKTSEEAAWPPVAGAASPGWMEGAWNEFDALLASEQGQMLEPGGLFVEPQLLVRSSGDVSMGLCESDMIGPEWMNG